MIKDGQLVIKQKALTITAASAEKEYDGTPLTDAGYTSTELAEGDAFESVTVTGTITEVGTEDNVPSAAVIVDGNEDVTGNYDIEYVNGTLTIKQLSEEVVVTITEHSGEVTYDSEEHTVTGYDVEISNELYTEEDFTFSGTDIVSGKNVGTYDMELTP